MFKINPSQTPNFWVYILFCTNESFYTGYTVDLKRRYQAHIKGIAAKYTRSFPPLFLAQSWPVYGEKHLAMRIERFIKKMNKENKQLIIQNPLLLERMFVEQECL